MAYPTVSAPYGLQPINRIDGMPYAGAIRQIPVAAGFGTAIFDGDTVVINSDGYLSSPPQPTLATSLACAWAVST